jgi:hypothetical protein
MLKKLQTTTDGLKSSEVGERLNRYGANILKPKKRTDTAFIANIAVLILLRILINP